MKRTVLFFLALSISCIMLANQLPQWLNQAVFYQVYPQSFKDSNGDGIGDLNGITEKLNYLQNLGITALWINPIFESPMKDAGYDVSDYYKIASRYGTKKDLMNLTKAAHSRNMKIVLDLVAGHTSDQHPWFKQSADKKSNKYTDFYIWTNSKNIISKGYVSGIYSRNGSYLKNFFDCQPALNYGFANPKNKWEQSVDAKGPQAVKSELKRIIAYWMDLGIDGFRVDMASSLIKNDSAFVKTKEFWKEMRTWFSAKYPQGVLIAEWSNPAQSVDAGFMIDFMMHFNVPGYPSLFFNDGGVFKRDKCYFDANGSGEPFEFIQNYTEQIEKVGNNGFVSVPTANHDINRINSGSRNSVEQLKTAMLFLLTLKGIPFIYYGDEIGMPYTDNLPDKEGSVLVNFGNENRAGSRTPLQWNSSPNAGFSTAKPETLYLPVNPKFIECNVERQLADKNSVLNFVKEILALRSQIPALGNKGDIEFQNNASQNYPLCYKRTDGKSVFLIVINPTRSKQVFELQNSGNVQHTVLNYNTRFETKGSNLRVETDAFGYIVAELYNRKIEVDLNSVKGEKNRIWQTCVGAGRANEGLRADWQEQLRIIKDQCGFKYIRMHGLLHDDMGVYNEDGKGNAVYNWQYIDKLYDFLLSINIKPFVSLTFMPKKLARGDKTVFWWKGNISPPKSYEKWSAFLEALLMHFTERYGKEEVKTWYFEAWNEPNLSGFWDADMNEFFKMYKATATAIKKVCPDFRVGGPGTARNEWVNEMIDYCSANKVPIDFISTHDYAVKRGAFDPTLSWPVVLDANKKAITANVTKSFNKIKQSALPNLELHYTEWSASYTAADPIHDSYHSASFILDKIKGTENIANSMSYWVFTDIFEESGVRNTPFHGGFGLLNYQGIKKPSFYAYHFLNKLSETELNNTDSASWICKSKNGDIQALIWDFTITHPGDSVNNQTFYKRDLPSKPLGNVMLSFNNIEPGKYLLEATRVGYKSNDAYSAYQQLGYPAQLSKSEVAILHKMSDGSPYERRIVEVNIDKTLRFNTQIRENDVLFINLTKN